MDLDLNHDHYLFLLVADTFSSSLVFKSNIDLRMSVVSMVFTIQRLLETSDLNFKTVVLSVLLLLLAHAKQLPLLRKINKFCDPL